VPGHRSVRVSASIGKFQATAHARPPTGRAAILQRRSPTGAKSDRNRAASHALLLPVFHSTDQTGFCTHCAPIHRAALHGPRRSSPAGYSRWRLLSMSMDRTPGVSGSAFPRGGRARRMNFLSRDDSLPSQNAVELVRCQIFQRFICSRTIAPGEVS